MPLFQPQQSLPGVLKSMWSKHGNRRNVASVLFTSTVANSLQNVLPYICSGVIFINKLLFFSFD